MRATLAVWFGLVLVFFNGAAPSTTPVGETNLR